MSEPFDLDAAVSEVVGEPFRFKWGGETFELSPILDRDIGEQLRLIAEIEALDRSSLEPEQVVSLLERVAGAETLARMRELRPVGGPAMMTLIRSWVDHQGEALGKFAGSPPSSAGMAKPSKATSRSARARRTS